MPRCRTDLAPQTPVAPTADDRARQGDATVRRPRRGDPAAATVLARIGQATLLAAAAFAGMAAGRPGPAAAAALLPPDGRRPLPAPSAALPAGRAAPLGVAHDFDGWLARAGVRTLTAWTSGEILTWGGDAVPALRSCFAPAHASTLPDAASFLGYPVPADVAAGVPALPLYGAGDALLRADAATKVAQCRAIFAAADKSTRNPDDAPLMAGLASLLVNMPDALAAALAPGAVAGTLEFTGQFLGDISQPPVAQSVELAAALPLAADGTVAGYAGLTASLAPQVRKLGLAIEGCQNSDLTLQVASQLMSLVTGNSSHAEYAVGGGARDAFYAAYYHGGNRAVAGVVRFTGEHRADNDARTYALSGSTLHVQSANTGRVLDLVLRTDVPYAVLDASFNGRLETVTLGNVMAGGTTVNGDTVSYVADADTLVFDVPTNLLDDCGVQIALAQQA